MVNLNFNASDDIATPALTVISAIHQNVTILSYLCNTRLVSYIMILRNQKEEIMKCPHLIKWVIESCKADCRPYVPSLSELEGYCKNQDHRKCSLYRKLVTA